MFIRLLSKMIRLKILPILITLIPHVDCLFAQSENKPVITFEKFSYDFGDLIQGDKVAHTFEFTNTGNQPLIISNVLTTCGCTVTEWPSKPIESGKTGEIKITFDSTGKMGKQNKIMTVITNADPQFARLSITASVLPKN